MFKNNKIKFICSNCGYTGNPKTQTRGNIFYEIFLWCLFLAPGVLYSIWRLSTKQQVCPKCKMPNMIPADSPKGKELLQKA